MFSHLSSKTLVKAGLLKDTPVYVQFYITSRCNLTCTQCNIRYANADVRECTLEEIKKIAENFAQLGVAIILLTGGEPFTRSDLPEIIREFQSRGIHVRMQTNGLATEEMIHKCVEYGGKDISISLDSLIPDTQDAINGGFKSTWERAIKSISLFTKYLPKKNSFASLGCVIQRRNLHDIENVIRFGTRIGWHTSLVPIHIAEKFHPLSFRTYDKSLRFREDEYEAIDRLVENVRQMRDKGYLLYDSDQYLDDIKRFVKESPITWRQFNNNICDSPNLYFAVLPNGDFAPCCDHRLPYSVHTYSPNFPSIYRERIFRNEVRKITKACAGCMYGSYPEITISLRFWKASWQRLKTFYVNPPLKKWPISYERMLKYASEIRSQNTSNNA